MKKLRLPDQKSDQKRPKLVEKKHRRSPAQEQSDRRKEKKIERRRKVAKAFDLSDEEAEELSGEGKICPMDAIMGQESLKPLANDLEKHRSKDNVATYQKQGGQPRKQPQREGQLCSKGEGI